MGSGCHQTTETSSSLPMEVDELTNSQAKIKEESTKKALLLKRKELKWKLMQASQTLNQAKLVEIKTALNYHRRKLSKAQALAVKLRDKYVKVVRSAKLTEVQLKTAETQLALQEKHVADERMQLTKLEIECIKAGTSLYGNNYKLPANQRQLNHIKNKYSGLRTSNPVRFVSRLSSLYDLNDSILKNLASYRLTRRFAEIGTTQLTDLSYSHNIHPLEFVCLPDLMGECTDKSCPYQHKSNYYMTDLEKLTDLLSYRPAAAGWLRGDDDLDEVENHRMCRVKLKQYAAKLIAKNANKPAEMIARAIVATDIRNDVPDVELLLMRRQLPKMVHLSKPQKDECPSKVV
jgi:hypothetical protein